MASQNACLPPEQPPGPHHALEDVLAHVRVHGGEGVVEQVHAAVAVHGTAKKGHLGLLFKICLSKIRNTVIVARMSHRKWRVTKQQLILWPDLTLLGCCLVSLHFQW